MSKVHRSLGAMLCGVSMLWGASASLAAASGVSQAREVAPPPGDKGELLYELPPQVASASPRPARGTASAPGGAPTSRGSQPVASPAGSAAHSASASSPDRAKRARSTSPSGVRADRVAGDTGAARPRSLPERDTGARRSARAHEVPRDTAASRVEPRAAVAPARTDRRTVKETLRAGDKKASQSAGSPTSQRVAPVVSRPVAADRPSGTARRPSQAPREAVSPQRRPKVASRQVPPSSPRQVAAAKAGRSAKPHPEGIARQAGARMASSSAKPAAQQRADKRASALRSPSMKTTAKTTARPQGGPRGAAQKVPKKTAPASRPSSRAGARSRQALAPRPASPTSPPHSSRKTVRATSR